MLLLLIIGGYFFILYYNLEEAADDEPTPPAEPPAEPEEAPAEEFEILDSVSDDMVDALMTDQVADQFLERSSELGGTGKMGIVNLGQISAAYAPNDIVDLASLQAKGLVSNRTGRLKVLAAGTLDKPLTVKADDFSVQAIKMITLTGGHAQKLAQNK